MNKKREIIVVLPHTPWNFPCDYIKRTSSQLAKRGRVIILNLLNYPTLRNLVCGLPKRGLVSSKKICFFPSFGLLPFQRIKLINRLNTFLVILFFRIFYFAKFGREKAIFWTFSPQLAKWINFFRWRKTLVYDRIDQPASVDPERDKRLKLEDKKLLQIADYVFVNSPYTLRYVQRYNKNSFLVPCGCATGLFLEKKGGVPGEIEKIKKPIIGFVGNLDHRLNFKLLYPLIEKNKNWSFVFVGKIHAWDPKAARKVKLEKNLQKLKKLPNVYFLGQKPKEEMPDLISGFDVCLIPYDISQEFVLGSNPMKLYEYLAMGKAVVSTPIEAVKIYQPVVKIGKNAEEFEKAIAESLKHNNNKEREKRRKIALENSWEEKVKKMWEIVLFPQ